MLCSTLPLLLPCPSDSHSLLYHGVISLNDNEFRFRILCPSSNPHSRTTNLANAKIKVCPKLKALIPKETLHTIKQRLALFSTVEEFAIDFKELLERIIPPASFETPKYHSVLIDELDHIGWQRVRDIDKSLDKFSIELRDQAQRKHIVRIQLPTQYPLVPPICQADLPDPIPIKWTSTSRLIDILQIYQEALQRYQELWNLLDELDANTIQLLQQPSRASTVRRFSLGNACAIQLQLDPHDPRSFPLQLQLFGPESRLSPIKSAINSKRGDWLPNLSTYANLLKLLPIPVPAPPSHGNADVATRESAIGTAISTEVECPICTEYMNEYTNEIPDHSCQNERCGSLYHRSCLKEYLQGTSTRISFNTIFGQCPGVGCNATITLNLDNPH
ncbi:WD-repeat region-domain-containing protein [Paraphysoderma sedebokerense]|nr:WD-repeat region-domain-containing protein [Paraphysoderma sedebokerense]